jgi:hypothetical protein
MKILFRTALSLGLSFSFTMSAQASQAGIELSERAQSLSQKGEYPLLQNVGSILEKVSKIRQLPIRENVKVDTLSRPELLKFLQTQFESELDPKVVSGEKALYTRWGLFTEDFDYAEFVLSLYTEQIGGFYDPKTRKLFLLEGMPLARLDQEVLVAHELTHALQDQSFNLTKYLEPSPKEPNSDRQLSIMAMIEGDASLTSSEYVQTLMKDKLNLMDVLGSVVSAVRMNFSFEKLRQAPRVLRDSMIFPYEQGMQFVQSFRNRGWSWEKINQLYKTPPLSTEQILHPSKYLKAENPQALNFKSESVLPGKAQLLTQGVMGEFGWRHYFLNYFENSEAKASARGWAGDYYQVFKDSAQQTRLIFSTLWDSPEEAHEFALSYAKTLQLRYPSLPAVTSFTPIKLIRRTPIDNFLIFQQGSHCLIAEGLPAISQAELKKLQKVAIP